VNLFVPDSARVFGGVQFLNLDVALSELLGLELWDSAIFDDSARRDPKTRPLLDALENAAAAEEREGKPLIRPIENGFRERAGIKSSQRGPKAVACGMMAERRRQKRTMVRISGPHEEPAPSALFACDDRAVARHQN
jgi:hypothetical protein